MEQTPQQERAIEFSFNTKKLEKFILPVFVVISLVILLGITFNSNIIFGDESFHTHASRWLAKNVEIPKFIPLYGADLYKLAYAKYIGAHITMAGLFYAFGFSEAIVKFIVPLMAVMTALVVHRLVKNHFSEKIAFISFVLFINVPIFMTYSVLYYSDIFLMLFLVLAIYFFFESVQKHSVKYAVAAGVFTALSILTKKTGLALGLLFILWALYKYFSKRNLRDFSAFKPFLVILVIAALLVLPWWGRNLILFKTVECGYPFFSSELCRQGPPDATAGIARLPGVSGTEATLAQFGLTSFAGFAYTNALFFMSVLGLFYILLRRTESSRFGFAMFLVFVLFLAQQTLIVGTYRVEDFAREFLPSVIPMVIFASVFVGETYNVLSQIKNRIVLFAGSLALIAALTYMTVISLDFRTLLVLIRSVVTNSVAIVFFFVTAIQKKYSQMLAGTFVVLILFLSFSAVFPKTEVLKSIKQFVPAFYEGANWIRDNTPPNANVLSLWTHQTVYTTERNSFWPEQQYVPIFTTNNQTAVDKLKEYGFNYIFVQKWSITDGAFLQGYPLSFINFLNDNNETFTKTFENSAVIIYKVN